MILSHFSMRIATICVVKTKCENCQVHRLQIVETNISWQQLKQLIVARTCHGQLRYLTILLYFTINNPCLVLLFNEAGSLSELCFVYFLMAMVTLYI
jgi:hypothetical protein